MAPGFPVRFLDASCTLCLEQAPLYSVQGAPNLTAQSWTQHLPKLGKGQKDCCCIGTQYLTAVICPCRLSRLSNTYISWQKEMCKLEYQHWKTEADGVKQHISKHVCCRPEELLGYFQ